MKVGRLPRRIDCKCGLASEPLPCILRSERSEYTRVALALVPIDGAGPRVSDVEQVAVLRQSQVGSST